MIPERAIDVSDPLPATEKPETVFVPEFREYMNRPSPEMPRSMGPVPGPVVPVTPSELSSVRVPPAIKYPEIVPLPVLVVYAIELFIVPFQVFWATGRSEFLGYGLILNPPELVNQGVVVARLDYIALEMMLTTLIIFIWYFISTRQGMSPR